MTEEKQKLLVSAYAMVAVMVLETIREVGKQGAPGGHIYAALMHHGCTKEQYDRIMDALVNSGKVTKSGDLYYAVES